MFSGVNNSEPRVAPSPVSQTRGPLPEVSQTRGPLPEVSQSRGPLPEVSQSRGSRSAASLGGVTVRAKP